MGKTKVLLDTNILISALGWNGKPRQVFQKCIDGELELITSPEQIAELRRVMDYPKFNFTEEQKTIFIAIVLGIATMVEITGQLRVIKEDHDDDAILETAFAGSAEYIISGDSHLLNLREFAGTNIITTSEFLEHLTPNKTF